MKYPIIVALLCSTVLGQTVPSKRPLPLKVTEITVGPALDGIHNMQWVKAVIPMSMAGSTYPDIPVVLICNDGRQYCYPLRAWQVYWVTAINPGEKGFKSCYPADNKKSFCMQIHDLQMSDDLYVVYVLSFPEKK